jgi:hypothetical protein
MIDGSIEHFRVYGWMRVRAAFSVDEAAAMRTAVWRELAHVGIRRDEPSTWTRERPERLQRVKDDPAFQAVGRARLLQAIDAALEGRAYEPPRFLLSGGVDLPSMWTTSPHPIRGAISTGRGPTIER